MIWHICSLEPYRQSQLGLQGYVFPPIDNADILHLITGSRIHLMKIDVEDLWYIPGVESNIQRLERLLTAQFSLWSTAVEKELNDSLKTRTTKTKEQQNQETKKDIARTINSTDITPNTVKLADKARLLYDCTIGYSYLPWKLDVAYLYRLSKVNLVRKILRVVDLRAGYTDESLAAWFALWQSREAKNKVASYLKIQIGTSPVKFLNAVLKKNRVNCNRKAISRWRYCTAAVCSYFSRRLPIKRSVGFVRSLA